MKFVIVICVVNIGFLLSFCIADKHIYGEESTDNYKLDERKIIDDSNNDIPKNYTIIYKYYGTLFRSIGYIEFNINANSSGTIDRSFGEKKHPFLDTNLFMPIFDAKIIINNATRVTATFSIYGKGFYVAPMIKELEPTKSLTFIYVKNAVPTKKPFTQTSIGKRREGDELIYFESRNVTNISRFPSRSFEYHGSEYLTYVSFSLNSPTAMVMVNTSFIGEQEFNAIVYDMNTEHFVSNVSVYGINSSIRPENYFGII